MSDRRKLRSRGPELLVDLADHCSDILQEMLGLPADRCDEIAKVLRRRMSKLWGGQQLYFPKDLIMEIEERDLQLVDEYNGRNRDELCLKYDISVSRFYHILRAVRAAELARRQADMFPEDTAS